MRRRLRTRAVWICITISARHAGSKKTDGGDGSCFDADGRLDISAANRVQVFDKEGKHLGNIPAACNLVSVTSSGSQRQTLYAVTAANVNGERKVWIEGITLLASAPKGRGK
jgi:sugar lactone lactonase YvrE